MHLTEEEVQSILTKVLDKLETDDRVKEMLESQYNTLAIQEQEEKTSEEMLTNFENDVSRAKDSVSDLKLSEGLTSTIWTQDNVVVSREFTTEIGKNSESILIDVIDSQIIE